MVTKADKGSKTVVLTKQMYINESNKLLNDGDTYSLMSFNPLNKVLASLKKFCKKIFNNKQINKTIHSYIYQTYGIISNLYLLPKLHKNLISFRPFVLTINSPTYYFEKNFLQIYK